MSDIQPLFLFLSVSVFVLPAARWRTAGGRNGISFCCRDWLAASDVVFCVGGDWRK